MTAGTVAIVGATSGMAMEVARLYAAEGRQLLLVARSADKLATLASDLEVRGASSVETLVADLAQTAEAERVAETISSLDADAPTTVLIAHGVLGDQATAQSSYAETLRLLEVNLLSVIALLTPLANHFETKKRGKIAVISSVAGDRGRKSNYVYGTAKGALNVFLSGLRARLAPAGVSVTTIIPGFVSTPMTAHLKQGPLFASAAVAGKAIHTAIEGRRNIAYVPFFWRFIMLIIKSIPEALFKRLNL